MRNGIKILNGASAILILMAFPLILLSVETLAAYRYMDKIQPGVSTMEEVEDEFGPPIESINTTTFKYDAPAQGLEAYVVEYSGEADSSEDKVRRLDIYLTNPVGSKNMAQSLGVSEPDLGAVNSEGKYEEFFGDVYSVIFIHESDSPDSGVVIVSFLTGEEFAALRGEDEAKPGEVDATAVEAETEDTAVTEENTGQSGAYGESVEGDSADQTLPESAEETGDQAGDMAADTDEAAREEVAEETEESIDISDEIERATGVDEAQVIQEEVEAEAAQGEEIGQRAQEIEDAAVETEEVTETADIETSEPAQAQDAAEGEEVAMLSPEAKFHMQQGMMYVSLARANPGTADENYSNALLEFSNAIKIYPDYTEAYSNRGVIYMHTGKYNLAKRDMNKASELSPEDPYVQYNLAALYSVSGDLDLSIEALDRSLANGFENYDALRPEGANSDPDLDNVRQTPEFRQTLEKYKIFIVQ